MVRRRWLLILIPLLLTTAGLLAGLWWLLATPQGSRRLLLELSKRTAVSIEARQIEGRLLDRLRLSGVRVRWPQGEARFETIVLRWRPAALWGEHLAIDELALTQGAIAWSAPPPAAVPEPAAFAWPRLEGWALRLRASVETLRIEGIELRPPAGTAERLERLHARLEWRGGTFSVSDLDLLAAGHRLAGSAAAGFARPLLRLDLQLALPEEAAGLDALALHVDLAPAGDAVFAGPLSVQGRAGGEARLQLESEMALRGATLLLRRFALSVPGRPGTLGGEGEVRLPGGPAQWRLRAKAEALDLGVWTGIATDLHGTVEARGSGAAYRGAFDLANRAAHGRGIRLSGPFSGDAGGIAFAQLDGAWLNGTLGGELRLGWQTGLTLTGALRGEGLDPAVITPEWPGEINLALAAELAWPAAGPMTARLDGRLFESRLRGQLLTGTIAAELAGDDLRIAALELHGEGFDLSGSGRLAERLDFRAGIARLSGLLPGAKGAIAAQGWLQWRDGTLAGALDADLRELAYAELRIAALRLTASLPAGTRALSAMAVGSGIVHAGRSLERVELNLSGSVPRHRLDLEARWPEGGVRLAAAGGWRDGRWAGKLNRLDAEDAGAGLWRLSEPAGIEAAVDRFRLASLRLAGRGEETLQLDGEVRLQPWQGRVEAQWEALDLARLNPWLKPLQLFATSSGRSRLRWQADGALDLAGRIEVNGRAEQEGVQLAVQQAESDFSWNSAGLSVSLKAEQEGGGEVNARLHSAQPGRLAWPEQGTIAADWSGLDLAQLRPWLPPGLTLAGRLGGKLDGNWLPGRRLQLAGAAAIDAGRLEWRSREGEVGAELRIARLDWAWRDASLSGGLELALAEYGEVQGRFQLPLPARLPAALETAAPLRLEVDGKMREQGLLAVIFPGLVQGSRGEVEVHARAGGSWQAPALSGSVRLEGAGAYFPAAGIELREVTLAAELAGDEVRIATFSARSGPGRLNGSGSVRLQSWQPVAYHGTLQGERFAAVRLPELQLLVSPDLTIEGTAGRLQVRGKVRLPELLVQGREQRGVVRESGDVILVGAAAPAASPFPLALDIRVQVVLGEHVLVKIAGVDARLAGELDLRVAGPEAITASGEIKVAQGIYATYGAQLRIERGRLLYSGGPIDQPTLDILALRTVGEVKAGVQVSGTPRAPLVKLYSEPVMPDTDVLAYIILGHPLGQDPGQVGLLSAAAGALLARGESAVLQDRIKRRLGVDVLQVEGSGDLVAGSMVTIGKYLSPRLYLSFGQSLFTNVSEARLRYNISRKWELESRATAESSGADLYYKIEFR